MSRDFCPFLHAEVFLHTASILLRYSRFLRGVRAVVSIWKDISDSADFTIRTFHSNISTNTRPIFNALNSNWQCHEICWQKFRESNQPGPLINRLIRCCSKIRFCRAIRVLSSKKFDSAKWALTLIRVASQPTLKEWLVGILIATDVGLLMPRLWYC